MELFVELISGIMLGIEYVEDEEEGVTAVIVDLFFVRFVFMTENK